MTNPTRRTSLQTILTADAEAHSGGDHATARIMTSAFWCPSRGQSRSGAAAPVIDLAARRAATTAR